MYQANLGLERIRQLVQFLPACVFEVQTTLMDDEIGIRQPIHMCLFILGICRPAERENVYLDGYRSGKDEAIGVVDKI